jgi:hypothetical protein
MKMHRHPARIGIHWWQIGKTAYHIVFLECPGLRLKKFGLGYSTGTTKLNLRESGFPPFRLVGLSRGVGDAASSFPEDEFGFHGGAPVVKVRPRPVDTPQ